MPFVRDDHPEMLACSTGPSTTPPTTPTAMARRATPTGWSWPTGSTTTPCGTWLPRLRRLWLAGCGLGPADVARLKLAMPGCTVHA